MLDLMVREFQATVVSIHVYHCFTAFKYYLDAMFEDLFFKGENVKAYQYNDAKWRLNALIRFWFKGDMDWINDEINGRV